MKTFVIDASVVIKWVIDEPGTKATPKKHRFKAAFRES
jgi:predicted nucleic acid-binding protein